MRLPVRGACKHVRSVHCQAGTQVLALAHVAQVTERFKRETLPALATRPSQVSLVTIIAGQSACPAGRPERGQTGQPRLAKRGRKRIRQ